MMADFAAAFFFPLTLLIVCLCIYFWGLAAKVRICLPFGLFAFF